MILVTLDRLYKVLGWAGLDWTGAKDGTGIRPLPSRPYLEPSVNCCARSDVCRYLDADGAIIDDAELATRKTNIEIADSARPLEEQHFISINKTRPSVALESNLSGYHEIH